MAEPYMVLVYISAYIGLFATSFYIISILTYYKKKAKKVPLEADDKTVSIIIPAFNEEESIARTIRSALSLKYPRDKLEIVVIDDGSKDNTYKIAKEFESKSSPKVRVFTKPNGGKGTALNFVLKKVRNEIVVTMYADTFATPDAVMRMIAHFYNERVMCVAPSMGTYKPKGILQRIQQVEYYMGVFLRKSFASVNAVHITPGAFSAYRKKFFDKYGGFDAKNITEDLEVALRIQSHNFVIENAPRAVVYTVVPNKFRPLLIQRRRWYVGLMKNLWNYRRLFGPRKGALGTVVLPVAVTTVLISIVLTVWLTINTLIRLRDELVSLQAINFQFNSAFELNSYFFENLFYTITSSPLFLISFFFIFLLVLYLSFSRKQLHYKESLKLSLLFFIVFYAFLFTFWWIVSIVYTLFNKEVVWRGEDG